MESYHRADPLCRKGRQDILFNIVIDAGITSYLMARNYEQTLTTTNYLKKDKNYYDIIGFQWATMKQRVLDVGSSQTNPKISGTIVPDSDTNIIYTNRCLVTDITVQKVDAKGTGLEGAVFQLKQYQMMAMR